MKKFKTASGEPPVLHRNSANLVQGMLDEVKSNITIIPDLKALIPPLSPSEFDQLKANILKEECRDPLLIWQTTKGNIDGSDDNSPLNVLIDGHNRYQICTENGVMFKVSLRNFPSLSSVREFMINNQLGRRNLTPEQMSYLRGLKYRNVKQEAGRPTQDGILDSSQRTDNLTERTREKLAKEFSVSPRTIMRDSEYSEGIDRLEPELRHQVLRGSQKLPKETVRKIGHVVAPEAARLSLAQIRALGPLDGEASEKKKESSTTDIKNLIGKVRKLANQLDMNLSTFNEQCTELIDLLNEAKKYK